MDEIKRNDDALFEKLNRNKKKKRRRRLITALVIIAVIAGALMIAVNALRKKVEANMAVDSDEVLSYSTAYGNISTRVSSSGIIEDVDAETVTVPEGVEVDEVMVQSNDKLQKGDVIATVDLTSVLTSMALIQEDIEELDKTLAEAGNDSVSSSVTAGTTGRLKKIYVTPQTDVADCMVEYGALALISLDGKMAVDFESDSPQSGDRVTVLRGDGSSLDGTVEKNVKGTATVTLTDNGTELDEQVRIADENGKELGSGTLYIHSLFRVTGFAGTVAYVSARENQNVYPASTICSLTGTGYNARYNSILKDRKEKEDTLLELLGLYQGGALRAPFDGTVIRIDFDEDQNGTGANAAASVAAAASAAQSDAAAAYSGYMTGTAVPAASSSGTAKTKETDGTAVVTMAPDESMLVKISVDEADILSR